MEISIKQALTDLSMLSRGVSLGLLCYDEPIGGLDSTGKAGLVRLLYDRVEDFPTSLIISHDDQVSSSFDNKLMLTQGPEEETIKA